jgi:hypothetical protein
MSSGSSGTIVGSGGGAASGVVFSAAVGTWCGERVDRCMSNGESTSSSLIDSRLVVLDDFADRERRGDDNRSM